MEMLKKTFRIVVRWVLLLVMISQMTLSLSGHPMPNSSVKLQVGDHQITGEAVMPLLELENALEKTVDQQLVDSGLLGEYFQQHIRAKSNEGWWQTNIESITIQSGLDEGVGEYEEVIVSFAMIPDAGVSNRQFDFFYDAIVHQVVTHEILVFLQDDWASGVFEAGESKPLGVIGTDFKSGNLAPLQVNLQEGSTWQGVIGMFRLGIHHIRVGLDHILFLLTLLLIAPLSSVNARWIADRGIKGTFVRFLQISFAFTLGHSVTLLLGSLEWFFVNTQWIEVMIAFTILISAVNVFKPIFHEREPYIAAVFGLIHGLAFSFTLIDMKLGLVARLWSVLGFNLGIEAMQLIIMLLFFPVLLLSRFKAYTIVRSLFGGLTFIAAAAWMLERLTDTENPITQLLNVYFG